MSGTVRVRPARCASALKASGTVPGSPTTTTRSDAGLKILLASASPRRKWLLEEAGYSVRCEVSGADELEDDTLAPAALALENASRKARVVAARFPDELVVAADTVVAMGGIFYGKPANMDDAFRMISELAGKTHEVVTGVVIHFPAGEKQDFAESSLVTFRPLGPDEIRAYLASIHPLDKAGAYAAQDDDGRIIERIEGSVTNVIGLPLESLQAALHGKDPGDEQRSEKGVDTRE
ncbi:MAG: septum formation protein Maf [Verrucomicrobiaceae bacterium]|nr:MAG: septum formation protein Maf [Verrucomicrobiaceae bacterium]